jgi:hypothetical protein
MAVFLIATATMLGHVAGHNRLIERLPVTAYWPRRGAAHGDT